MSTINYKTTLQLLSTLNYQLLPTHSPMWIRPMSLAKHNLFAGTPYKQIFDHTQVDDITIIDSNLVCVDCLGTIVKSYRISM